jgi:hypothetical protein
VVLDRAIAEDGELYARLEEVLHGKVHSATISELDLVNDKTIVDVRYAYSPASYPAAPAAVSEITTAAPGPALDLPAFNAPASNAARERPAHAASHAASPAPVQAGAV